MAVPRSDALVVFGVTGDLAHKQIIPGAVCDGEARGADGAGDRRRLPEVEPGAAAAARDGQHRARGRDRQQGAR